MHGLDVAPDGFCTRGIGSVDPCTDLNIGAARHVAAEAGWDLDRKAQLATTHALVEIIVACDGGLLREEAGAGNLQRVIATNRCFVVIKDGKSQVLDVRVDAITHHKHQDDAADDGQRRADRIALKLQRLALRVGEHASRIEQSRPTMR